MATRWILRRGSRTGGFRYLLPSGQRVGDARTRERIASLRVPPAWREVHIAQSAETAIQAWGLDARGRRQYVYSERAVKKRELRKYYRVRQMGRDLPRIRASASRDLARRDLSLGNVAAAVLRLIDTGGLRVGNERYEKENNTFGITTLRKSHVRLEGRTAVLSYRGKGDIEQRHVISDPEAVKILTLLMGTPGRRLFRYLDANEDWANLAADDVNEYLLRSAGFPYTAKDFRTWVGSLRAAVVLAELGPAASATEARRNVATAMRLVASDLGNTPTICRKSYVHPVLIERYLENGDAIALPKRLRSALSDDAGAHIPEERALIRFLDLHFPERRRRRRHPSDEEHVRRSA